MSVVNARGCLRLAAACAAAAAFLVAGQGAASAATPPGQSAAGGATSGSGASSAALPDPSNYINCVDSYLGGLSGSSSAAASSLSTYLSCIAGASSTGSSGSGGSSGGGGSTSPTTLPGQLTTASYTNSSGTLSYQLYVPSTYKPGTAMPLVVALHGCTQTADVFRQLSGWDTEAESKGFIVLFPQQSSSRNSEGCWNWFESADMQRGSGEPSIIDGMVTTVEHQYSVDTQRVYVAGFSAGGAMANVMAATYPDVFAAVGVGSGCEYNGLPCVGAAGPAATQTGQEAYQAMGTYARVMPAIVFQGDADDIVAPANAPLIVQEWQVTDNYVKDGAPNGAIPTAATSTVNDTSSGGQSYTVTTYGDGQGGDLIEYWLIHGMNHAWSGGSSTEQYADPSGPSETAAMYAFFSSHPLP
jgi:poly(hydroxyalkanoate) depolymerase family esterase